MHYCSQEKEVALLYLGEGKRCSTVLRRRDLVLYCSQEKETGVLLFSGEDNMYTTVIREGNWCTTVLRRRKLLFCIKEKGKGALLF